MEIYQLSHRRTIDAKKQYVDLIDIGYFKSLDVAQQIQSQYAKELPGFRDYPDDFLITPFEVEGIDPQTKVVYGVWYEIEHKEYDDIGLIDIVADIKTAEQIKIKYAQSNPRIPIENISVDQIILDVNYWSDGFFTYDW
jgi:hypothetical protein